VLSAEHKAFLCGVPVLFSESQSPSIKIDRWLVAVRSSSSALNSRGRNGDKGSAINGMKLCASP